MPAPIKDIGFDQIGVPGQDDTLSQDGVGGGGGVGLPSNGAGGVVDNPNPTITTTLLLKKIKLLEYLNRDI